MIIQTQILLKLEKSILLDIFLPLKSKFRLKTFKFTPKIS